MEHEKELSARAVANAKLSAEVIRGPESWQFFAFVFAAFLAFGLSVVDEVVAPALWKVGTKVALFILLALLFMVERFRNRVLMPLLRFWKQG